MGWLTDPSNINALRTFRKLLNTVPPPGPPPGGPEILLMHFGQPPSPFYDYSPLHQTVTNTGSGLDGTTFLFPPDSGSSAGGTDLLVPQHPTAWDDLWTGDFTVEFASLPTAIGEMGVLGNVDFVAQTGAWIRVFALDNFGSGIHAASVGIEGFDNTGSYFTATFGTIFDMPGQLMQLCVMKTGLDIWVFSMGTLVLNGTLFFNVSPGTTPMGIYNRATPAGTNDKPYVGLLDEIRVTKAALYPTSGYVVSPVPFPDSP